MSVEVKENKDLNEHKEALNNLYENYDFSESPWGYDMPYMQWTREAICRPIYENLIEGTVLDAGGGFGFFRQFTKQKMINLDLSYEIIKHDKSPLRLLAAIEKLPLRDHCIENVTSIGVLRHCFRPENFIDEAYRVLKPGGRLLLTTPAADWPRVLYHTPWFLMNVIYRFSPYSIKGKFEGLKKRMGLSKAKISEEKKGVIYDRLFNRDELAVLLEAKFEIVKEGRSGKNFPSKVHPPRKLIDRYFDSNKHGQFLYFICEKRQ